MGSPVRADPHRSAAENILGFFAVAWALSSIVIGLFIVLRSIASISRFVQKARGKIGGQQHGRSATSLMGNLAKRVDDRRR